MQQQMSYFVVHALKTWVTYQSIILSMYLKDILEEYYSILLSTFSGIFD